MFRVVFVSLISQFWPVQIVLPSWSGKPPARATCRYPSTNRKNLCTVIFLAETYSLTTGLRPLFFVDILGPVIYQEHQENPTGTRLIERFKPDLVLFTRSLQSTQPA